PYSSEMAVARAAHSTAYYAAAESAVRQALTEKPLDGDATQTVGFLCLAQGKYPEAAEAFARATQIDPSSAGAYYQLAVAEESSYDYYDADQALRRAIALDPHNAVFKARLR